MKLAGNLRPEVQCVPKTNATHSFRKETNLTVCNYTQHVQNIGNVKNKVSELCYYTLCLNRGDYESPETECRF